MVVVQSGFSPRFRRMCQVAASSVNSRSKLVVDNLVELSLLYGSGRSDGADDVISNIDELFDVQIPKSDAVSAIDRCIAQKSIFAAGPDRQSLELAPKRREAISSEIAEAERLENSVRAAWFLQIEDLVGELTTETAWGCLVEFLRRLLNGSGLVALEYLDESILSESSEPLTNFGEDPAAALERLAIDHGIEDHLISNLYKSIRAFFGNMDEDRVQYCEQLLTTIFDILAIGLDPEVKEALKRALPNLTIFLDTNVIYSVIGAQTNPLSASSSEIVAIAREEQLPFKLYCHEATLAELERTIEALRFNLARCRWSQAVSRAIRNAPHLVSSLEVMYHSVNANTPTPPEVFLSRFSHLPTLLEEYSIEVFRRSFPETANEMSARAQLVAEFEEYASTRKKRSRKKRLYESLNHDVTVWIESKRRMVRAGKGPVFSGSIMLSSDSLLARFDKETLSKHNNGKRVVTRPDTLLQALRPFLRTIPDYANVFNRLFTLPEMRISHTGSAEAVRRVAALISTFDGISEFTAEKILVNDMLMGKVASLADDSDELARLVDSELIKELERLEDAHEEMQEGVVQAHSQVTGEVAVLREFMDSADPGQQEILRRVVGNLESAATILVLGGVSVKEANMAGRDFYQAKGSNFVAQGKDAHAEGVIQNNEISLSVDLGELAHDLQSLKAMLLGRASTPEQYHAVAEVEAARTAAVDEDKPGVLAHLKAAGSWVLEIAKEAGVAVAEAAMKQAIGL